MITKGEYLATGLKKMALGAVPIYGVVVEAIAEFLLGHVLQPMGFPVLCFMVKSAPTEGLPLKIGHGI